MNSTNFEIVSKELQARIMEAIKEDKTRLAVSLVFKAFDDFLIERQFSAVIEIIDGLTLDDIHPKVLIGILSITNPWKNQSFELSEKRNEVRAITEMKLLKEGFDYKRVENIFSGLK